MKKRLSRTELTNIFKNIGLDNTDELFHEISKLNSKYKFKTDPNFLICGRREYLIERVLDIVNSQEDSYEGVEFKTKKDRIDYIIYDVFELTYTGCYPYMSSKDEEAPTEEELNLRKEKDDIYSKNDIVSLNEKRTIDHILYTIYEYLNE